MNELADVAGNPGIRAAAEPIRNLLILHTPILQDISDWFLVTRRIDGQAPDIEVRIATNGQRNSVTRRWRASCPSLVFSPCTLEEYAPNRGKVYAGRGLSKLEQIERLVRQGLPAPLTVKLTGDLVLEPVRWGRYVIAKPLRGSMGRDVYLVRTADLADRRRALTLNDAREMIIQPYIEHSQDGYPAHQRVLTLFGKALHSARNSWGVRRRPLEEIADDPTAIIASNDNQVPKVRILCNDEEFISLAEHAHAAFPECPVLGVDVVRDRHPAEKHRGGGSTRGKGAQVTSASHGGLPARRIFEPSAPAGACEEQSQSQPSSEATRNKLP